MTEKIIRKELGLKKNEGCYHNNWEARPSSLICSECWNKASDRLEEKRKKK